MSISEEYLELSLKVQENTVKIITIEKSVEELKNDLKKYLESERERSFKKWEWLVIVVATVFAAIMSSIVGKILP